MWCKMIKILLKYTMYGVAVSSLYLLLGLILLNLFWNDGFHAIMGNFAINMLGGLAIGTAASVSGIVHEFDNLNSGLQAVIRTVILLAVAIPIAFGLGWISSVSPVVIAIGIVVWLLMFVAAWLGFYLFGNREVKKINDKIKARDSIE